jgi:hypothetical protein
MWSERGQGTVEYVGIVLVVAVLLGAIAGGLGAPTLGAQLAASVAGALVQALGESFGREPGTTGASAAEQAAFARAIDAGVSPDERPSLRDVELDLIARHGAPTGRSIFRQLVVGELRSVVPGLGQPYLFATAVGSFPWNDTSSLGAFIHVQQALRPPAAGDAGEYETPTTQPNAHVVTVSEADASVGHAFHPGVSRSAILIDVLGAIPVLGTASHAGELAIAASRLASAAGSAGSVLTVATDAAVDLPASETTIPAGSRAGDEIVTWKATRQPRSGGPAVPFTRSAVVRDGVVIGQGIALDRDGAS